MRNDFVNEAMPFVAVPVEVYDELFCELGQTLWALQLFEDALACTLALVFKIPYRRAVEDPWRIIAETRKKTAGTLLSELMVKMELSSDAAAILKHLVDERNWLVHRMHRENGDDLYDSRAFEQLIGRVKVLREYALVAQTQFAQLVIDWTKKYGISEREIDERALSELKRKRQSSLSGCY